MISFLLLFLLAAPAEPAASEPTSALEAARAALAAAAPDCDRMALAALQTGALDEGGVAEAWILRGRCALLGNDLERAERAFAVAVRVDPAVPGVDHDTFRRARAAALPASLSFAARRGGDVVSLELLSDDRQLAHSACIVDGAQERARVPLEVGRASQTVTVAATAMLEARLLDRHGNVLLRQPVTAAPAAPAEAPPSTPPRSGGPGVVTWVGAGLLGAGMIGMTAASVAVASTGATVLDEAPILVAAVGAGAAVFLVGAGLVVLDQGLGD